MAVAQIGEDLDIGAGTISGSYIVERYVENTRNVESEDIDDENGELNTRIVYKKHNIVEIDLICINSSSVATDFPEGQIAAHTDFTSYYVESASLTRTKSAARVSVRLVALGIT